jgi:hypothetical protein
MSAAGQLSEYAPLFFLLAEHLGAASNRRAKIPCLRRAMTADWGVQGPGLPSVTSPFWHSRVFFIDDQLGFPVRACFRRGSWFRINRQEGGYPQRWETTGSPLEASADSVGLRLGGCECPQSKPPFEARQPLPSAASRSGRPHTALIAAGSDSANWRLFSSVGPGPSPRDERHRTGKLWRHQSAGRRTHRKSLESTRAFQVQTRCISVKSSSREALPGVPPLNATQYERPAAVVRNGRF